MKTMTNMGAAKKSETICMFSAGSVDCACSACQAETKRLADVAKLEKPAFKGAVFTW